MTKDQMIAPGPRLSFGGLVRSEMLKARGLRSSSRLLIAAGFLPVSLALITAAVSSGDGQNPRDATLAAVAGLSWIPLLVVMLFGTVVATAEYEHGSLQTTFAVAPRRASVVLAKVAVVAGSVFTVMLTSVTIAFVAAALVLGDGAVGAIGQLEVVRVITGTAIYGAAAATIATSLGLIVRSSIAGIAATLGFLYVLPALLQAIPVAAVTTFARTIPGPASGPLEDPGHLTGGLPYGSALVAVLTWTIVSVTLSCVMLQRRDV